MRSQPASSRLGLGAGSSRAREKLERQTLERETTSDASVQSSSLESSQPRSDDACATTFVHSRNVEPSRRSPVLAGSLDDHDPAAIRLRRRSSEPPPAGIDMKLPRVSVALAWRKLLCTATLENDREVAGTVGR